MRIALIILLFSGIIFYGCSSNDCKNAANLNACCNEKNGIDERTVSRCAGEYNENCEWTCLGKKTVNIKDQEVLLKRVPTESVKSIARHYWISNIVLASEIPERG